MSKDNRNIILNNKNNIEPNSSRLVSLLVVDLLIIIFFSTIFQGLLFERDYISIIIILGIFSLIFLIISLLNKKKIQWRNFILFLSCVFTVAYVISLFNAAYIRSAVLSLYKSVIIVVIVTLIINLKNRVNLTKQFLYSYFITGVGIAVLGLDAVWGSRLINLINNLVAGEQIVEGQAFLFDMVLGNRLASVFQYPNTTGSFLLIAWLTGIGLWLSINNKVVASFLGAGTILCVTAFILTLSRGAYIMAVPLMILALILIPRYYRLTYGVCLFITGLASILLSICFAPGGVGNGLGFKSWLITLVITLIFGYLITYIIEKIAKHNDAMKEQPNDQVELNNKEIHKSHRRNLYAIAIVLILLTLAGFSVIWFWTEPINLTAGQPIYIGRNFNLDQTDNYLLEISFIQPIDEELACSRVYLDSYNQKEAITKQYNRLLNIILQDATKVKDYARGYTYTIPFKLADEKSIEQRLIIQGSMAKSNNQITALSIISANTGEKIKNLRLSRKFLSEAIGQRIETILLPSSSYSRFAFYNDGLVIIKDYSLTGAGGGGWEHLYNQYQSYKYVSKDIHSYGFQLMIEVGLFGLLLLAALVVLLIYKLIDLWRHPNLLQSLLWLGAVGILSHSMIDFDFAFFSMQLIFWTFMALLDFPEVKVQPATNFVIVEQKKNKATLQEKPWLTDSFIIVLSLASIFWPLRIYLASNHAGKYTFAAMDKNVTLAETHIRKAISLDPLSADYKVALAKLLVLRSNIFQDAFNEGNALVEDARDQAHDNYLVLEKISDYYQKSAQWEAAYEVENRITTIRPLTPLSWQNKGTMIQNALSYYGQTEVIQPEKQHKQLINWLNRGLSIPNEMATASQNKLQDVRVTAELQTMLDTWQIQISALE